MARVRRDFGRGFGRSCCGRSCFGGAGPQDRGKFQVTNKESDHSAAPPPDAFRHGLDETTLLDLLALAGPADGPELMRRLIDDMGLVHTGMTAALAANDGAAMRWHSHVLLSIAGTIGAPRVYALAKRLNDCARSDTCLTADPAAVDLLADLGRLLSRLREMAGEMGMTC